MALEKSKEDDKRVVEEGEENLQIQGSAKRPSKGGDACIRRLALLSTFEEVQAKRIVGRCAE